MNKKFKELIEFIVKFKDITALGSATVLTNAIGGIFWLYMATLLGTEQYGQVSYLISIAIIASTISLVGMANTIIVYGAKGVKLQSTVFLTGLISSSITSIILFFVFVNDVGTSLYVIGYVTFTLITSDLVGGKKYLKYSKVLLCQKLLLVFLAVCLYHIIGLDGVILGIAISFLPFIYIISKTFKEIKIDLHILRGKYKFVINSFLLDISNASSGSLDKIIIAPMLGFALLGNYQLGLQLMGVLTIIPGIFYQYILPQDASGTSTKKMKKIMILISIVLAVLAIILSPIVIPPFFSEFTETIEIIQIMGISIISSTIISTYVSKFLGLTKSNIVICGTGVGLASLISLLLLFTPILGANGAALAVLISSIIHAAFFIVVDKLFTASNSINNS